MLARLLLVAVEWVSAAGFVGLLALGLFVDPLHLVGAMILLAAATYARRVASGLWSGRFWPARRLTREVP